MILLILFLFDMFNTHVDIPSYVYIAIGVYYVLLYLTHSE